MRSLEATNTHFNPFLTLLLSCSFCYGKVTKLHHSPNSLNVKYHSYHTICGEIQSLTDLLCLVTVAKLWLEISFQGRALANGQSGKYKSVYSDTRRKSEGWGVGAGSKLSLKRLTHILNTFNHQAKDEEGEADTTSPIHSYIITLYSVFYQYINTTALIGKLCSHLHLDGLNGSHFEV